MKLDMRLGNDLRELPLRNAWKAAADAAGMDLKLKLDLNDKMCSGDRPHMLRMMLAMCADGHAKDMLKLALANPLALMA